MIPQRTRHDCAICTIAMALDRTYEEVMAAALEPEGDHKWRPFDPDKGCKAEEKIIERLGLKQMETFRIMHRPACIDASFFLDLSWRRRSILAVPSLNKEGGWHSVYFDGERVIDPCVPTEEAPHLRAYASDSWASLRPDEIITFAT